MSLDEIRQKARKRQNERRLVGILSLLCFVAVTLFFIYRLYRQNLDTSGNNGSTISPLLGSIILAVGISVGIYFIWTSVFMIRSKLLAIDAGIMTSVQAYRRYFKWEHTHGIRVSAGFAALMGSVYVGAIGIWMRSAVFPLADAVDFTAAYIFIGGLWYFGFRHHRKRIQAELAHLDSLERDA